MQQGGAAQVREARDQKLGPLLILEKLLEMMDQEVPQQDEDLTPDQPVRSVPNKQVGHLNQ